jgi:hypothetical protein
MQWRDVSPRWPWLLGLLVVNYAAAAAVVAMMAVIAATPWSRPLVFLMSIPQGVWEAVALMLAVIALQLVRQRSVQLACAVLFPTLLAYVIVIANVFLSDNHAHQSLPRALVVGLLSVMMAAVLTGIHWLLGWTICLEQQESHGISVRFRLVDMLAWTLAVSLPLMLFNLFRMDEVVSDLGIDWVFHVATFLGISVPVVVVLLSRPNVWFVLGLSLLWIVGFVVLRSGWEWAFDETDYLPLVAGLTGAPFDAFLMLYSGYASGIMGVLLPNLLTLRWLGYRWQRVAVP